MSTRFEAVLHGLAPERLRPAAEEALDEIQRLDGVLSLYRPETEIAQVNARAHDAPVRVSPEVFALLERARRLWEESGGAFDPTVGPLMRCWGLMQGEGRAPGPAALQAALEQTGMQRVALDPERREVRFERAGMMLDLGALGKGYAVGRAAEILREAGVPAALIHGGTSTVYAYGSQPDGRPWRVSIEFPPEDRALLPGLERDGALAVVELDGQALSVSGIRGRYFEQDGQVYGHLLDPRTGRPAGAAVLSAVVVDSAEESDALSTAVLVGGAAMQERLAAGRPGLRSLVVERSGEQLRILSRGLGSGEKSRGGSDSQPQGESAGRRE